MYRTQFAAPPVTVVYKNTVEEKKSETGEWEMTVSFTGLKFIVISIVDIHNCDFRVL
jgi:hypothetical protein